MGLNKCLGFLLYADDVKKYLGASLGQEDHLEKEMATHSSILAWEIPWTEAPSRLQSMGLHKVRYN